MRTLIALVVALTATLASTDASAGTNSPPSTPAVPASAAGKILVGGYSKVSTTNEQVIAAAQFFVKTLNALSERETGISLVEVLGAEQQVVTGMNYRLRLKVKYNGTVREAYAVVWRKVSGEYELTSWTWTK